MKDGMDKLLRMAALMLNQEAAGLRDTNFRPFGKDCIWGEHGLSGKRSWADEADHERYEAMRLVAKQLRILAKSISK